jgi:hypothetical protein
VIEIRDKYINKEYNNTIKEIMAHFLKGRFKAFYQVGPSECVRDVIRFRKYKETSLQYEYVPYTMTPFITNDTV